MSVKTLYKKDTKGKIRIFQIWTDGAALLQQSGLVDGKQTLQQKKCTPKNIGKSNEVGASEQAISEMNSRYAKKLDEGYFKTKKLAEEEEVLLPMLAKSIDGIEDKVDWKSNPFAQPKLDGMRCLAIITQGAIFMISRKGKSVETLPHIRQDLRKFQELMIKRNEKRWIIDGELYAHGLTFQENMKLIKKARPESVQIKFHTYDMVLDSPFAYRFGFLGGLLSLLKPEHMVHVATVGVTSKIALDNFHKKCLKDGYEGTILRHTNDGYKMNSRANQLLKNKDFIDIACRIIDISPAKQRTEWGVPTCIHNGKTFRAGTKMSHADKKDLLTNCQDYIGRTAEIRFFEYSDTGVPRFPIMVGIRLDK